MPVISPPASPPPPPVQAPPQPGGIPPQTQVYVAPYCVESDIPDNATKDSQGVSLTDVPIGLAICAATDVLFQRTRRVYRSGRAVIRPTRLVNTFGSQSFLYPYSSMAGYGSAWGFADTWAWSSIGAGWWQYSQDLTELVLTGPVTRINSVIVDGAELTPTLDYNIYDRRRLVRVVNPSSLTGGAWPWNQQLQLPITMPGTWQIDYEWGRAVPALGKMACAELASSLLRSLSAQDKTKAPQRATSYTSNGVTIRLGDALEYLKENLTGLPICDQFISSVNPTGSRTRAKFYSPNMVLGRTS